jgi:hypothetical protein
MTSDTGFTTTTARRRGPVVGGRCEQRLALNGRPRERTFAAGEVFGFSAADIHRVSHAGSDPAVTLHVYSPPLQRMGAYFLDDDGALARRAMSPEQELRPLEDAEAGEDTPLLIAS